MTWQLQGCLSRSSTLRSLLSAPRSWFPSKHQGYLPLAPGKRGRAAGRRCGRLSPAAGTVGSLLGVERKWCELQESVNPENAPGHGNELRASLHVGTAFPCLPGLGD